MIQIEAVVFVTYMCVGRTGNVCYLNGVGRSGSVCYLNVVGRRNSERGTLVSFIVILIVLQEDTPLL